MKNIILTAPITLNMTNLFGKTEKATGKPAAKFLRKIIIQIVLQSIFGCSYQN